MAQCILTRRGAPPASGERTEQTIYMTEFVHSSIPTDFRLYEAAGTGITVGENGYIVVSGDTFDNTVHVYQITPDGTINKLSGVPGLSNWRTGLGAAGVTVGENGYFAFAGGQENPGTLGQSTRVDIYKITPNGTITKLPDIPNLKVARDSLAGCGITVGGNGYITFAGGSRGPGAWTESSDVDIYQIAPDDTVTKFENPDIPYLSRSADDIAAASVTVGDTGYMFFTLDYSRDNIDVYKITADGNISKLSGIPDLANDYYNISGAGVTVGNTGYVFFAGGDSNPAINAYKVETGDKITKLSEVPNLEVARTYMGAAGVTIRNTGYIAFAGGWDRDWNNVDVTDIYKITENGTITKFQDIPKLSRASRMISGAGFAIGGSPYLTFVGEERIEQYLSYLFLLEDSKHVGVVAPILSDDVRTASAELREWQKIQRIDSLKFKGSDSQIDALRIISYGEAPKQDIRIKVKV